MDTIKTGFPKSINQTKTVLAILATIVLVASVAAAVYLDTYQSNHPSPTTSPSASTVPTSVPFDYNLSISPVNGAVVQGNSLQTNIDASCLQGSTQSLTLHAGGGPIGATYSFSNPTFALFSGKNFNSTLTITVPPSAPIGKYTVNITSTAANGAAYTSPFTMTVLNPEIQVTGTVECDSSNDTWGTQIQFVPQSPTYVDSNFTTFVSYSHALQKQGTYSILLPNDHLYTVIITWQSLGGTGPIPTVSGSGTVVYGSLKLNCSSTTLTQGFTF